MIKRIELWLWTIRDEVTGKLRVTRHRMTEDDAASIHPGATRVPGSLEWREVEQSKDAELSVSMDAWMRGAPALPGASGTALD
jgi:hypothetical protein